MAVQPQTPYKEYDANGVTTSFALEFDCEKKDHLIVTVDGAEPPVETWSLNSGHIVFASAPDAGKKIEIKRNTPYSRSTNFQAYDNSFRPGPVNGDFDRIWLKLQELGVADWLMKLYINRLHQQQEHKINDLKVYVDDRDDELRAYLLEEIEKQGVALDQLDEYYNYLMERLAEIAVSGGWEASFVVDASGKNQQEINNMTPRKVNSVAELLLIPNPTDGQTVIVKNYRAPTYPLAKPHIGGGTYVYNSAKSTINNNVTVINGWELQFTVLNIFQAGAYGDFDPITKTGHDDTQAILNARAALAETDSRELFFPCANYLVSDTINLSMNDSYSFDGLLIRGEHSLKTHFYFKANAPRHVLFRIFAPSGDTAGHGIRNISISNHPDTLLQGVGIQLKGADFCVVRDFYINELHIGLHLYNNADGYPHDPEQLMNVNWVEFNRFETGRLNQCQYNIMFEVDGSDASFHGNTFDNIQNQIRPGGGVGVYCKGEEGRNIANLYNIKMNMQFFGVWNGGKGAAYMFKLERANLSGASGYLTCEGDFTIQADETSTMNFSGPLHYYDKLFWDVQRDYPNPSKLDMANIDSNWGRITFDNFSSKGVSNVGLLQWEMEKDSSEGFQRLYNTQMKTPFLSSYTAGQINLDLTARANRSGGYPTLFSMYGDGKASIGASFYGNNPNVGLYLGIQENPWNGGVQRMTPKVMHRANGEGVDIYGGVYRWALKGVSNTDTNVLVLDNNSLFSDQGGALSLGKSGRAWSNIYSYNAVTVVSDARHKSDIAGLADIELECAFACGKLYRRYKLKAAVESKGEESARYHIGVIAQDIVQCFTEHGLDWRKYGIITYESWDAVEPVEYQPATYDEQGNMLTPEIKEVAGQEAGEIYMVRYEELNCFINAGIIARIESL